MNDEINVISVEDEDDFQVVLASKTDTGEVVLTSQELTSQMMEKALAVYDPTNRLYTTYLAESASAPSITLESIENWSNGAQSDLTKIQQINSALKSQINMNDILGMVVQSISNNINTDYKLSYKNFGENKSKAKALQKAKAVINDFNAQIDIENFITQSVMTAYTEGTYICLLKNNNENWIVHHLPLGVAEMSGYSQQNNPIVFINIANLRTGLQKTIVKDKKGKALIFKDTEEEIKTMYNDDVYKAFKNRDTYAKLDVAYTGTVRIGNLGRKYGLSPLFRALRPLVMLSSFEKSDEINARSRAKKIIHQRLRKELLGPDGKSRDLETMAFSHAEFMKAFRANTVVYTSNAGVESILYVEPKVQDTNSDKINAYRNQILSSLGVGFFAEGQGTTAAMANISLKQLMQCINTITRQVEKVLQNFYRTVLDLNGIDPIYIPDVKIIDSEMLEMALRMELSKLLYTTFNCSLDTTLGLVGVDLEDERAKREQENADGLEEIFAPRVTAFTNSGKSGSGDEKESGRPADKEETDKQLYDEQYNKNRK